MRSALTSATVCCLLLATLLWPRASCLLPSAFCLSPSFGFAPAPQKMIGGHGTLYIGGWPNKIYILDEAAEKVTGEIVLKTGAPRDMDLSFDRKKFYVLSTTLEDLEVIDIATRQSLAQHRLSEGRKKVRVRSFTADPLDRFLVLLTKTADKQVDRFEISGPSLVVYDLKERKVTRTIPWPKDEEREFVNIMFSPDGKLLYFFSDDVLIYDTTKFEQVDKWELSRPIEEGFGRFDFGPTDVTYEEPGFFTGIFLMKDPVQNRQLMGIGRVNLPGKSIDYYPLGPARRVSFALAPDRKRAYGLLQEIGQYEFWGFDLENRKLLNKVEFPGRPRMAVRTSSNGKLLYVFNAGNTIDLYEAATYRHLRTLTLDFDNTTELYVIPPAGSPRTTTTAGRH